MSDLLVDPGQIDVQLVKRSLVRVAENFEILAGNRGDGPTAAIDLPGVNRVIDYLRQLAKSIVLDVPCTYDEFQFEALASADDIVLVGEQSIASIRTLKLILDTLRSGNDRQTFHVVINRYDANMDGLIASNLEIALGLKDIRTIPDDRPGVLAAANEGRLLRQVRPHSPVLTGIAGVINTLLGTHELPAKSSGVRLLSRIFSAFKN